MAFTICICGRSAEITEELVVTHLSIQRGALYLGLKDYFCISLIEAENQPILKSNDALSVRIETSHSGQKLPETPILDLPDSCCDI